MQRRRIEITSSVWRSLSSSSLVLSPEGRNIRCGSGGGGGGSTGGRSGGGCHHDWFLCRSGGCCRCVEWYRVVCWADPGFLV